MIYLEQFNPTMRFAEWLKQKLLKTHSHVCIIWSVDLALKTCLQLVSKGSQYFNQYKLNLQQVNNLLISRVYKLLVHGSFSQLLSTDVIFKFIYTQQTVQFLSHLHAVIPNKIQCSLGCSISNNSLKGVKFQGCL